jgi:hypothetical protein
LSIRFDKYDGGRVRWPGGRNNKEKRLVAIEILGAMSEGACLKTEINFQLSSTLFCEGKRGLVDP